MTPDHGTAAPLDAEPLTAEPRNVELGSGAAGAPPRRSRWSVVAHVLSALGVLAVTGAVVAAGTVEPGRPSTDVPPVQVEVPAAATRLVCPGPPRLATEPEPGDDVAYDPQFDPSPGESTAVLRAVTAAPTVSEPQEDALRTEASASGELSALGVPDEVLAPLRSATNGTITDVTPLDRAVLLRAEPAGDAQVWAGGSVGVTTLQGDLRGLVAATCQQPSPSTWLVGGSTEIGSSARLVLQNPGLTAATVQVQLWGPAGPVEVAGSPEFLVPAGSERAVLLEGVAAEQRRIVVHVQATGGLVAAYLQDSQLRGLVPAGVDYVVGGRPPDTRQVVTGLSVLATDAAGADPSSLRLLTPQDAGTARLTFLGPEGVVALPGTDAVALEAGAVLDVPLGGLPPGDYTVVVDADVPVVAGALVTRGAAVGSLVTTVAGSPLDRAWAPTATLGASGPLALPPGAAGRLLLGVPEDPDVVGGALVVLEMLGSDGDVLARRKVQVRAGTTLGVPFDGLLTAGRAVEADGSPLEDPPAAPAPDAADPDVAAVVVRTSDPRIVWGAVLSARGSDVPGDELIAVLAPVPPAARQAGVGVVLVP